MAIQQLVLSGEMTEEEITVSVSTVISSLGQTSRDFEHASLAYNSDFFKDEPIEFKRKLCTALNMHFSSVGTNSYWQKNSE